MKADRTSVTVVSALRLHSLVFFANSINPTWDEWPVALWSTIEINVGLMCACLPTLRLILVRMWPRVFGSTLSTVSDSHATNTSVSPRRAKTRVASVDTEALPISPRLMEADTAFELDAKYPTWDERDDGDDSDSRECASTASFENDCHAK